MTTLDRRSLLALTGAAGITALLPSGGPARAQAQKTFKAGGFEISTFSDGHIDLPISMFATNADEAKRNAALAAAGQAGATVKSPINVTLIRKGEQTILVDVGSGTRFVGTAGKLSEALDAAGVDPEVVTHVVYTHAHPDHIWGTINDFDELSFPNAAYHVAEAEWNFWMSNDAINQVPKDRQAFVVGAQRNLKVIKDRIKTIKPGQDIVNGLHVLDTSGHTPGHISIQVGTGNDRVVILGDALTHPVISFQHPEWRPAADQIPEKAVATRKRLLEKLASEKLPIIGYHLPPPGLGRVEKKGTGFVFAPGT